MTAERDKRNIAYTYWAEGREEGLVQGREEGREEGRMAIVKRMVEKGYPVAEIATIAGLTETETALILGGR